MKPAFLKLILINIGVTLGLLFTLNLLAHIVMTLGEQTIRLMGWGGGIDAINKDKATAQLPNYEGRYDEMFQHFRETTDVPLNYEPSIGWSRGEFSGETIMIDRAGNRVHQPLETVAEDTPKVHIFGGSTVWGTGVVDNETLPAFYQNFAKIPVVNKGETAFISRQTLLSFVNLLSTGEEMNGVVFYDGVNDVQYGCRVELEVNQHSRTQVFADRIQRGGISASPSREFQRYLVALFWGGIQELTAEVADIIEDSRDRPTPDSSMVCDNDADRAQRVAEALIANWEIAHDLAEARGIEFMAVLQPVSFIGNPRLDHIQPTLDAELGKQYRAVYPRIQQLIEERNYDWIQVYTPVLNDPDMYFYIDFCHVSGNGNQRIARRLYRDTLNQWEFLQNGAIATESQPEP